MWNYNVAMATFPTVTVASRFENVTDCQCNLSAMISKPNQMVNSRNKKTISHTFCPKSNYFPCLKAQEIIWF